MTFKQDRGLFFSSLYEFWVLALQHWCSNSINISDSSSFFLFLLLTVLSVWFPSSSLPCGSGGYYSSRQHSHFGHEDKERGAGQKVCAPQAKPTLSYDLSEASLFSFYSILICTRGCSQEYRDSVTKEKGKNGFQGGNFLSLWQGVSTVFHFLLKVYWEGRRKIPIGK